MAPWKKGRGKLGALAPLIGTWQAEADSDMGQVHCTRTFAYILNKKYVQLDAQWVYGDRAYDELAVYGADDDDGIVFWSFTSDGKRSTGKLVEGSDLHEQAIAFEAQMPAGLARMAYWPHDDGGMVWVVEAMTKKGWKRFTEHHYKR